jgi:UDP-GlcNAc:undecaprenyl-phosphate GlcNAc-1-phosphate transferase
MNLGFDARGVDVTLYGLQIVLGVLVFESMRFRGALSLIFLGAGYIAVIGFFIVIHFVNWYEYKKRNRA